ncbi:MAG: HAD family hydrolase [Ruminococcaceae bacterium]|nr:HAD family hydrolase [Oscillospiraceae bacterium]
MKEKKIVLFDLDGTVTDSAPGICKCVAYALDKFGIKENDTEKLKRFIGPPLKFSFAEYYGIPEKDLDLAVKYYRDLYAPEGIFDNILYDGIKELIIKLKAQGKRVVLATAKPEIFAIQIIEKHGLKDYFDCISGASMDEKSAEKTEIINRAFEMLSESDRSRAVMVGDREYDIIAAKETGIESVGVLYGFGSREELEKSGADLIVETVAELGDTLM